MPLTDIDARIADLRRDGGSHFFVPETQHIFPEADFHLCARRDLFDFVLRIDRDTYGFRSTRIDTKVDHAR